MKKLLLPLIFAFFALFLLLPIWRLLAGAFFVPGASGQAEFSFAAFALIFENPFYRNCFQNSFGIAVSVTGLCLLLTLPLAQALNRFEFPCKRLLSSFLLLPLILPPFVGALGLKQMLSRFGSVNLLLAQLGLVDLHHPPDWFGEGGFIGIVLLQVLHLYPILLLSVQAALANVDPSLRDAARNLGASNFYIFRSITVPLAMPGIFAGASIVFIAAFTDLGVPLMFDFQTTVPSQIFNLVTQADNPVGYAWVILTLLVVLTLFAAGKKWGEGQYAMLSRSASYGDTQKLSPLAGALMTAALSALIFLSVLPHLGVIIQSFASRWFMTVLPGEVSTQFYGEILQLDLTRSSMQRSLLYATLSAGLDVILGVIIAWLLTRGKSRLRPLLDLLAMLPLALPGLVMAFAYYVTFSQPLIPQASAQGNGILLGLNRAWQIFDPRQDPTLLLVIAYAIHRLPYIVRAAVAGLQQTSVTLEEASANLGATPLYTLWRVTVPLISANLIAGTIMTFSFAMLDVSNGMILAQESAFYPITKAIYVLMGRITPTAPAVACALGVVAMLFLAASLLLASRLMGQKMGQLFKI